MSKATFPSKTHACAFHQILLMTSYAFPLVRNFVNESSAGVCGAIP